jgi:hypothetical protein
MAYRVAGSKGAADVVALGPTDIILAQCKTGGTYPYAGFGPSERLKLASEAAMARARAVLVHKPTGEGGYTIYPMDEWPDAS